MNAITPKDPQWKWMKGIVLSTGDVVTEVKEATKFLVTSRLVRTNYYPAEFFPEMLKFEDFPEPDYGHPATKGCIKAMLEEAECEK